jgi:hypothetical protein
MPGPYPDYDLLMPIDKQTLEEHVRAFDALSSRAADLRRGL